jgi:hypothetical protein
MVLARFVNRVIIALSFGGVDAALDLAFALSLVMTSFWIVVHCFFP